MLRLTARQVLRLVRPLHAVTASTCVRGKPFPLLTPRSFTSTVLGPRTDSNARLASVTIAPQEATHHQRTTAWEQKVLVALQIYKKLYGDLLVPRPFVVPTGDERWPSKTWGYNLGTAVNRLRIKLENKSPLSTEFKEELETLDFARNASQYKWDNIVLPALKRFHQVHEHADVPKNLSSRPMTKLGRD